MAEGKQKVHTVAIYLSNIPSRDVIKYLGFLNTQGRSKSRLLITAYLYWKKHPYPVTDFERTQFSLNVWSYIKETYGIHDEKSCMEAVKSADEDLAIPKKLLFSFHQFVGRQSKEEAEISKKDLYKLEMDAFRFLDEGTQRERIAKIVQVLERYLIDCNKNGYQEGIPEEYYKYAGKTVLYNPKEEFFKYAATYELHEIYKMKERIPKDRLQEFVSDLPTLSEKKAKKRKPENAIRAYCVSCSGGSRREVQYCKMKECPLWEHRLPESF